MDAVIMIIAILVGLIGFDVAALRWGVDSRESVTDDHAR
jgi:hypothetical protein